MKIAEELLKRYEALRAERTDLNDTWYEVAYYCMPTRAKHEVYGASKAVREKLPSDIYDTTAIKSMQVYAAGMAAYLTNPSQQWIKLAPKGKEEDKDEQDWLFECQELLYEKKEGVAWLTINREARRNALSLDMIDLLSKFLDEAEQQIFEIGRQGTHQGFSPLKDVLVQTWDRIEQLFDNKKGVTGLPSGFTDLDHMTAGLQSADLIVIAARPSMGKTTLALNMAQHITVKEKKTAAFFSMEMSKDQLAQRLLCAQARIDAQNLRKGYLTQEDWQKLTRAVGPLSEASLYVDDTASLSVMEIRAKARRLKADKGLDAVFVDYLQLMRGYSRSENRQQELSEISRSLKALAKELNIPVVALSQLSRAVEKRTPPLPILSDLMESGGIEANADVVLFIYRDAYYYKKESKKGNIAEIIVAKQRNGPTGEIELVFHDRFNMFANVAREEYKDEVRDH